jgi:hypothetical protein
MHFSFHGWTGDCVIAKPGGLILQNVKHDGFKLARDIRVTRIWAGKDPGVPNDWLSYKLGAPDFPAIEDKISENREDDPKHPYVAAPKLHLLANYPRAGELSAEFNSPGAVLKVDGESNPLFITQRYLFTKYSDTPFHEPLGVLTAARLYPLLQFRYDPINPIAPSDRTPPRLIRVDHRMEFEVDAQTDMSTTMPKFLGGIAVQPRGTVQAAVIQDPDVQPTFELFPAGEKPLANECIGEGFRYNIRARRTDAGHWDNIHVWGAMQSPQGREVLPPTPGVNHGVHLHWRWGKFMTAGATGVIDVPGGPQFAQPLGPGTPAPHVRAGGPLIDYRLPHQSMRFAITAQASDFGASRNPSERDFDALFTGNKPQFVRDGAKSITIWLSHQIQLPDVPYPSRWEGTVMLPGLYFAHNPEVVQQRLRVAGAMDPVRKSKRTGPYGWICESS